MLDLYNKMKNIDYQDMLMCSSSDLKEKHINIFIFYFTLMFVTIMNILFYSVEQAVGYNHVVFKAPTAPSSHQGHSDTITPT